MVTKQKITGRADSFPGGLAMGAASSILLTILMSVVLAKAVDIEKLAWEKIGYGIMIQTILASFIGAKVAYSRIKRQRLLVCVLAGCIYYCTLLMTAAVFFGGQYEGMGVTALLVVAGSGSASLVGLQVRKAGKGRIGKIRYR